MYALVTLATHRKTSEIIEDILKVLGKATTEQHKQYILAAQEVKRKCDEIIYNLSSLQEQINGELKVVHEAEGKCIQRLITSLLTVPQSPQHRNIGIVQVLQGGTVF